MKSVGVRQEHYTAWFLGVEATGNLLAAMPITASVVLDQNLLCRCNEAQLLQYSLLLRVGMRRPYDAGLGQCSLVGDIIWEPERLRLCFCP